MGLSCAWWLQRRGHAVTLVAPDAAGPQSAGAGSSAALGVLMGQVFHRAGGRAWRLRQQSLALWSQWRSELEERGHPIPGLSGLLLLAADAGELAGLERLAAERQRAGLALALWSREALEALRPALPPAVGGLHSPADGQLDPLAALEALRSDALRLGLRLRGDTVVELQRRSGGWNAHLGGGDALAAPWVVLAAGITSAALLEPLGHERPMEPVLGQALELQLTVDPPPDWPGPVVWRGWNLVPRPEGRLWLGATLEPGQRADPARLEELRQLDGAAPSWLREAQVRRCWQGLRHRPLGRPAPLLEVLEPGLLLVSGHYRNGVLLAPASAAWVAACIETGGALSTDPERA